MKEYSSPSGVRESVKKWQAILNELRMENIRLKNELSRIIKEDIDKVLLEQAEDFQQRFVQKDQLIDLLRLDIARLMKWNYANESSAEMALYHQTDSDISRLVLEFNILKDAFSFFVAEAEKAT